MHKVVEMSGKEITAESFVDVCLGQKKHCLY